MRVANGYSPVLTGNPYCRGAAEVIDGISLRPLMEGAKLLQRRYIYYFNNEAIVGLRDQNWKFLTHTYYKNNIAAFEKFDQLPGFESSYDMLFNAVESNGESYSFAHRNPDTVARMKSQLAAARQEFDALQTRPEEATYPK